MKNEIIYGNYKGCNIIMKDNVFCIKISETHYIPLTKENILSWELIDEKRSTSAVSMIGRGFLGGLVLGPIGAGVGIYSTIKGQKEKLVQIVLVDKNKIILKLSNDDFIKFQFYMS